MKAFVFGLLLLTSTANANPLSPGGAFTSEDMSKNAFSHPGKSISKEQKNEFFVGNSFFKLSWVAAPSSTEGRDGLGPTYNAVACAACHPLDGRGKAFSNNTLSIALLFRIHSLNAQATFGNNSLYGGQINPVGIDGVPGEGKPTVTFTPKTEIYDDGTVVTLQYPQYTFESLTFGIPKEPTFISPRIGAQIIGLGLLEAIPESVIAEQEDVSDSNKDGISGRRHIVLDVRSGQMVLGRFGWKAEQPTVEQQTAAAFLGDIGITSALFPDQNCPPTQLLCITAIHGGSPELEDKILSRVSTYAQFLAVPKARHASLEDYNAGLALFKTVGCASCHTPSYTTDGNATALLNQNLIYPFTDLLLHDMGRDLSDTGNSDVLLEFLDLSLAQEWRTPPLWGIGMIPIVNGHQQLMHDGRAGNVEEAILWHGGEGLSAKNNFKKLSITERQHLIDFVNKL